MVVPPDMPVTSPVVGCTLATELAALVQLPPVVMLFSAVVNPWQTAVIPVIGVSRLTVTVVVLVQPAPVV